MTEIAGVDFSTARPSPASLARAGYKFALGYLKPLVGGQPNVMELRPGDVTGYPAAGLMLGAVWETTNNRALSGAPGGTVDAAQARARAAAIGYPTSAVIFAAVDFAVTAAQLPTVHAYLDAFCDNVGHPAGSYGSYLLVEARAARRPGEWLWQTAAWSRDSQGNPLLSEHAHLYQRAAPSGHWPVIPGTDEDVLCHPLPLLGADPTGDDMPLTPADLDAIWSYNINGVNARDRLYGIDSIQLPAIATAVKAVTAQEDPQAIADAIATHLTNLPNVDARQVADLVIAQLGQRINTPPAS